jgi:hypothetical protein
MPTANDYPQAQVHAFAMISQGAGAGCGKKPSHWAMAAQPKPAKFADFLHEVYRPIHGFESKAAAVY